jgi:hypothetical protein
MAEAIMSAVEPSWYLLEAGVRHYHRNEVERDWIEIGIEKDEVTLVPYWERLASVLYYQTSIQSNKR